MRVATGDAGSTGEEGDTSAMAADTTGEAVVTRTIHNRPMRVVALPDKLRGTASATEVASAIARGAALGGWACEQIPLADGGEGTLEAFGGANRVTTVSDPLGRDVVAPGRPTGSAPSSRWHRPRVWPWWR